MTRPMVRASFDYGSVALPVHNGTNALISAVNRRRIWNGDRAGTPHSRLCLLGIKLLLANIVSASALLKRARFADSAEDGKRAFAGTAVRTNLRLRESGGTRRSAGSKAQGRQTRNQSTHD